MRKISIIKRSKHPKRVEKLIKKTECHFLRYLGGSWLLKKEKMVNKTKKVVFEY